MLRTTEFTRDGRHQVFRGDVVAVGNGVMITADRISMDRQEQNLKADGHVIILTESQVYLGDTVIYSFESGDFLLTNSSLIANDKDKAKEYSRIMLGLAPRSLPLPNKRTKG